MQSPTRSRYSVPRPEAGVAEWASKIKALQQQVDADEEAEQKKLEEEIAASRLARMRRSRGLHGGSSRASSVDLSSVKEILPPSTEADEVAASDEPKPGADRRNAQADALERLNGSRADIPAKMPGNSFSSRPEPMSLAAFIGGRATGPRLNKHAPQADAHDPTQFEQRTHVSAPHPIFGRGGIAMPGMMGRHELTRAKAAVVSPSAASGTPKPSPMASSISEQSSHLSTYKSSARERTTSTPGPSGPPTSTSVVTTTTRQVTARYTERVEHRPSSPLKNVSRERTMSTPSAAPSFPRPASSQSRRVDSPQIRPKTPTSSATAPIRSRTPVSERSWSPPPRSVIAPTPSLAKPIAPEPKPVQPLIPSQNPSPAFLKPLSQKDPTPSISRLQGRGFVQNMVQASRKLEGPSSPLHAQERHTTGRKSSVLDRWPGAKVSSPSPPPQTNSPKPMRMQKSFTVEPRQERSEPVPVKPLKMQKSFTVEPKQERSEPMPTKPLRTRKSFAAEPQEEHAEPEPHRPLRNRKSVTFSDVSSNSPAPVRVHVTGREENGLGSKTTLVVIKNTTGGEYPEVDELGVQRDAGSRPHSRSELPAASGAPLIHPTRDRAKRPKRTTTKGESKGQVGKEAEAESAVKFVGKHEQSVVTAEESTRVKSVTAGSKSTKVTDRWEHAVIGVKVPEARQLPTVPTAAPPAKGMVGRRALPGLAVLPTKEEPSRESSAIPFPQEAPRSPVPVQSTSSQGDNHVGLPQRRPSTSSKQHKRIPSTGNRATVMDVAQALTEQDSVPESNNQSILSEEEQQQLPVTTSPISETPTALTVSQAERRRSSYDRFSAVTLPALVEEATPTPTPAGTLKLDKVSPLIVEKLVLEGEATSQVKPDDVIQFDFDDISPPLYDVTYLVNATNSLNKSASSSATTISVEVLAIRGDVTTTMTTDVNIFHDDEVLAVVYRAKSKSSGLVDTTVWSWEGKDSALGDREAQKLRDIGKRYGTTVLPTHQYYEPSDLVDLIGGTLVTRQGPRTLWSVENTAMHRARCLQGVIYIEEIEFNVKNLCSGFSYCLTVLGNAYVWHGLGSLDSERSAAVQYAGKLGGEITELFQGNNDSDETFWMVLGDEDYATADYWKWRRSSSRTDPRIWRIDASSASVEPVRSFIQGPSVKSSVFVADCVWEIYVIVGFKARANRADIRFGIEVATGIASAAAGSLPYKPTVHVLVVPTQLPVDAKAHFRDINEAFLNANDIPDHMNILTVSEALEQLGKRSWPKIALKDETLLPLGLDPSSIPQF